MELSRCDTEWWFADVRRRSIQISDLREGLEINREREQEAEARTCRLKTLAGTEDRAAQLERQIAKLKAQVLSGFEDECRSLDKLLSRHGSL